MLQESYVVAVDQGTSGTSASLYNRTGLPVFRTDVPVSSMFPKPGWVEQDPFELLESIRLSVQKLLSLSGISPAQVNSIGLANQAEPLLLWDIETGNPVYPSIGWQCVRSAPYCKQLINAGSEPEFRSRTGLPLHPEWPATKIKWVFDHFPSCIDLAKQRRLAFSSLDTWFIHHLTNEKLFVTDPSTAARSGLYNITTHDWDPYLIDLFGANDLLFPKVIGNATYFGEMDLGFDRGIPWTGNALDQAAALLGQACLSPGETKITYGTCSALWLNLGKQVIATKNLATSIAWELDHNFTYAIDGEAGSAGATINWLTDKMGLSWKDAELATIAENASPDNSVIFVPALNGLGAPHWSPDTRGAIFGLSSATGMQDLLKAALDSVAFGIKDVVESINKIHGIETPECIIADGGMAANQYLMQFQADILGRTIVVPTNQEGTSAGVAILAGLGSGYYSSIENIRNAWEVSRTYKPGPQASTRQKSYGRWEKAIQQSIYMDS